MQIRSYYPPIEVRKKPTKLMSLLRREADYDPEWEHYPAKFLQRYSEYKGLSAFYRIFFPLQFTLFVQSSAGIMLMAFLALVGGALFIYETRSRVAIFYLI